MSYSVNLKPLAKNQLKSLPKFIRQQLETAFELLEDDPYHNPIESLRHLEGYRDKVGDYRMLFTVNEEEKEVNIYRIKHRSTAYEEN